LTAAKKTLNEIHKTPPDQPGPAQPAGSNDQDATPQRGDRRRQINQGDIFWVRLEEPHGLEPGIAHPYVVVQENVFNHSRIPTLVVCALTTNIKQANAPGNVLLDIGEANLPKPSIVVVSKVSSVDKTQLGEYIGSLTGERVRQILAGMQFLQSITEQHE
jgi:mRNA interferase MazF